MTYPRLMWFGPMLALAYMVLLALPNHRQDRPPHAHHLGPGLIQAKALSGWRWLIAYLGLTCLLSLPVYETQKPWTMVMLWLYSILAFALSYRDLTEYSLPVDWMMTLLILGLLFHTSGGLGSLSSALFSSSIGFISLFMLGALFYAITGKIGLGNGDPILLAAIGAWTGWRALPVVLFISSILGIMVLSSLKITHKKSWNSPMPLGAFLLAAGYLKLLDHPLIYHLSRLLYA